MTIEKEPDDIAIEIPIESFQSMGFSRKSLNQDHSNGDSLERLAKQIEDEHKEFENKQREALQQEEKAKKKKRFEKTMYALERIMESPILYIRKEIGNRFQNNSAGSFRIIIADNENMEASSCLYDSRDFAAHVNESGVDDLIKTFCKSFTYQGYDIYIDGELFKPSSDLTGETT